MVDGDLELQRRTGLRRGMLVETRVTGHRDRFGVEVEITSRYPGFPAFIDAALLSDQRSRTPKEKFPEAGSRVDAIVVSFMPNGELRLDARTSVIRSWVEDPGVPPPVDT